VLVLFAVATLAALFTAIIGTQLAQVSRHGDVVRLRNIAQAGLWLANEQLTYSMAGADWRPPGRGYLFADGHIDLRVSYWPPLDVTSPPPGQQRGRLVQVVSTAIFPDNPFLRYTMIGLKPLLLTDYARFITDRYETNRPARLGVAELELGGAPRGPLDDYVFSVDGPIRSNTHLTGYGQTEIYLHTWDELAEGASTWADLRILRDDRIEVAGDLLPDPNHPAVQGLAREDWLSLYVNHVENEPPRIADLFLPVSEEEATDYAAGLPDWWRSLLVANSRVLANLPGYMTLEGHEMPGSALAVSRMQPPEIDAAHPDTQKKRYLMLTRESGSWRQGLYGPENIGQYGWGWTNFGGIYVDNFTDIQYGHDLDLLRGNWLASVGHHDTIGKTPGDERPDDDLGWDPLEGPPTGPADWWDATGRYYAPPGVEIVLHGESLCPYIEMFRDDPDGDGNYWKSPEGTPTISYDYTPWAGPETVCQPRGTGLPIGIEGAMARFPFPANGVIYAEGNVRIRGVMPPIRDNGGRIGEAVPAEDAVYLPYFGEWTDANGRSRRFDLQVVSGGTIYIEGDLLTPASAGMIGEAPSIDRYYGSRLALLARDYVCVNTTALNPRPLELFHIVGNEDVENFYNDWYPYYPEGGHPRYLLFQGEEDDPNWDWPGYVVETEPTHVEFVYQNVRLQNEALAADLADLRLIIGHSGWYAATGTAGNPEEPPAQSETTGDNEAAVDVLVAIERESGSTPFIWDFEDVSYAFRRSELALPSTADESGHWYTDADNAEFLPNTYQSMLLRDLGITDYLSGNDIITFASRVTPIEERYEGDPVGWAVAPDELAYLLGPVAIAPPRAAEPLPVEIEAMIYAQNGSWFVIPGPWFNEDPGQMGVDRSTIDYPGYREPLNIRISVYGAITENMPADVGSAAEWTSKWGGPYLQGDQLFLSYQYDPLLRWPRWDPASETWAPRFPNLPMTSDMLIWGERVTGQAGG